MALVVMDTARVKLSAVGMFIMHFIMEANQDRSIFSIFFNQVQLTITVDENSGLTHQKTALVNILVLCVSRALMGVK